MQQALPETFMFCWLHCFVCLIMCATKKYRSVLSWDMRCIEFERQVPKNTTLIFKKGVFFVVVFFPVMACASECDSVQQDWKTKRETFRWSPVEAKLSCSHVHMKFRSHYFGTWDGDHQKLLLLVQIILQRIGHVWSCVEFQTLQAGFGIKRQMQTSKASQTSSMKDIKYYFAIVSFQGILFFF